MNRFRLLLIAAGAVAALAVVAVAIVFSSSFQTWAARKAIASRPGLRASVGEVSAGLKHVALRNVRYEQDGLVFTVPAAEIDLPLVSAGFGKKILIARLVAKGWTLDLLKSEAAPASGLASGLNTAGVPALPQAVAQAFAGVFAMLHLPFDLTVDGVQFEGVIVLPEQRGTVKVGVTGGGLGAGREGNFDITAQATLADPAVNAVDVRGGLAVAMDTPRTISRVSAKLSAAASGRQFPQGVKLTSELAAARTASGETYALAVESGGQEIVRLDAQLPGGAARLDGTWKLNVRDADVAPFTLGKPLPAFVAAGRGKFDTDAALSGLHATGRLNATLDRLQVLKPELAALGELKIASDFDLTRHGDAVAVQGFDASVVAAQPVASVRSLQAFEFNLKTGELRAADGARELFGISLQGVPVAWAQPFMADLAVTGGQVRGELAANPRGGGASLRSTSPLTVDDISIAQGGKTLVQHLDVSINASADYTPKGWQAEIVALSAKSGGASLFTLSAKAGQLAGVDQALKATGKLVLNLPAALQQPIAANSLRISGGEATIDFIASLNSKKELLAKVSLPNLATGAEGKQVELPALSAEIRADIAADGNITFNVPVLIQRNERKTDLSLAGAISPAKDGVRAIDAQIGSTLLVVEDAQIFAALMPGTGESKPEASKTPDAAPPWVGLHGAVTLSLKRVIYSDSFEVTNLAGRLQIDAGMVKLEGLQAGLGQNGRANLNGTVTFNASMAQPYVLAADVAVKEFDVGPLFRAIDGSRPPTIEGKFSVASKLASRASKLGDLAMGAGGEFQLTSRGGIFRGLPVSVSGLTEKTGKLAGLIASAGTAISSITGKKDTADVANKAQAVAEFAKGLNPISYDQLSVVLSRDAALNTTLKDFTLISPELRLTGGGTALHREGACLLEDSLAMEFKLRARGRQGDLLKYLGVLEAQPDDFGYAACTLPIQIGGRLSQVDASETSAKLMSVALEKSGVTDMVKQLFGAGK